MRCTVHPDVHSFAATALPWLEREPVVNSVPATATRTRLRAPAADAEPPLWLTIRDEDGVLVGAAIGIPGRPLLLPATHPTVGTAIASFLAAHAAVPGVLGPVEPAEAFATRWSAITGASIRVDMRQRIFQLDRATPPPGVRGRFRTSGGDDIERCVDWFAAFQREVFPGQPRVPIAMLETAVVEGRVGLWECDERLVCMAGSNAPAGGVVRIGPVYTPPELRGHGYASACAAALSQRALDAGAVACTLATDQSNPTSNALYQRIGYYPVADAVSLTFEPAVRPGLRSPGSSRSRHVGDLQHG